MPSQYTQEERDNALLMISGLASVSSASAKLRIPERTLRYWRQQHREKLRKQREERERGIARLPEKSSDSRQFGNLAENENQRSTEPPSLPEQLQTLRDQIMQHTFVLSQSLSVDDERVNERAIALTRLIDRVLKLETAIQQSGIYKKDQTFRLEFKYPDGTIHDIAPWNNTDYMTEEELYPDGDDDDEFIANNGPLWEER